MNALRRSMYEPQTPTTTRVITYWSMGRGKPPLPGRDLFAAGYLWSQAYCEVFEGCVAVPPFYLR